MAARQADIAILGGGLAGGLVALALARWRRDLRILLVDEADHFGGNRVWTFLGSEVGRDGRELLAPLVTAGWRGYAVRFATHARDLPGAVYTVTSARLDAALHRVLPNDAILTDTRALACSAGAATLADGTRIEARAVIDARGLRNTTALTGGWQKCLGRHLRLEAPHGLERPILIDADLPQANGLRFLSVLPLAADELRIEDVCHGSNPNLPSATLAAQIDDYARTQGWQVREVLAEDQGVRPVVDGGDFDAFWRANGSDTARAGMRAGLFHPFTGSTLPEAVRWALAVTRRADADGTALASFSRDWAERAWQRSRFARRLAAMVHAAPGPDMRVRVLEALYRLDPQTIERMQAGRATATDLARLLAGANPVPLGRALNVLAGRSAGEPLHGAGLAG